MIKMGSTGFFDGYFFKTLTSPQKREWFRSKYEGGKFKCIKDTIVGNVYYAVYTNGKINFALVYPFHVRGDEVIVKEMDEYMCPYYYNMPVSYLKLLSPTDNEYALKWRKKVKETTEAKSKKRTTPVYIYVVWRDGGYKMYDSLELAVRHAQAEADRYHKAVQVYKVSKSRRRTWNVCKTVLPNME